MSYDSCRVVTRYFSRSVIRVLVVHCLPLSVTACFAGDRNEYIGGNYGAASNTTSSLLGSGGNGAAHGGATGSTTSPAKVVSGGDTSGGPQSTSTHSTSADGSAGTASTSDGSNTTRADSGGATSTSDASETTGTDAGGAAWTGGFVTSGTSAGPTRSTTGGAGSGPVCGDDDCCPADPDKTDPGDCGCGIPDSAANCGLGATLVHRYSFDDTGSIATDSQSGADASVTGTTLDGSGKLVLSGSVDQYAALPEGIISALTSITVEAWFTHTSDAQWQRIFDFGSTQEGIPGERGVGFSYLFFTPRSISGYPRATFTNNGVGAEIICESSIQPADSPAHIAVSINTVDNTMTVYQDGAYQCSAPFFAELSSLNDVNNWLGRSQFKWDGGFVGSIDEVRIYDVALNAEQVALSFELGPDAAFSE